MDYLRLFESFNDEYIHKMCNKYHIINYTINEDNSIDVDNNVDLSEHKLYRLPLKFNKVSGSFICNSNKLMSLKGGPKYVGGSFICYGNQLISLEGCPKYIGRMLNCHSNQIKTFEHFPKHVSDFSCFNNPIGSIWNLFRDITKIELFNDMDIIQDDDVVILDRLNYFLEEIGKNTIKSISGYKYI